MHRTAPDTPVPFSVVQSNLDAKETVVLLHSSASSKGQWRALTAALEPRFRVFAPDLYGYGDAGAWPGERPLTLADEAALIDRALPTGSGKIHLVGHSYGGAVALRAALENPDRVRSLTLIEPVAFYLLQNQHAGDRPLMDEVQTVAEGVWQAVARGDYWAGMAQFVDYWNGVGSWRNIQQPIQQRLAPQIVKVAMDFAATFRESTRIEDYRSLTPPTLILYGDRSAAPTRRIAALLAGALPNRRIEAIAGAGHMSPMTHANAVNAAVAEHLDGAARPDADTDGDLTPVNASTAGVAQICR